MWLVLFVISIIVNVFLSILFKGIYHKLNITISEFKSDNARLLKDFKNNLAIINSLTNKLNLTKKKYKRMIKSIENISDFANEQSKIKYTVIKSKIVNGHPDQLTKKQKNNLLLSLKSNIAKKVLRINQELFQYDKILDETYMYVTLSLHSDTAINNLKLLFDKLLNSINNK